jgi:hypothetical protein
MATPEQLLDAGLNEISRTTGLDRLWTYYEGKNETPFAPVGVNAEYESLRSMSALPLVRLAVRTPCQRLRVDGLRSGVDAAADKETWDIWKYNHLDARQRVLYVHALVYGYGVASVWPNQEDRSKPFIKVEDPNNLYLHKNPADPFTLDYVVKAYTERVAEEGDEGLDVAMLYTAGYVYRYETTYKGSDWTMVKRMVNPLGRVPFVLFAPERDACGTSTSMVQALVPMQRAIDTMRFNLLLAAQFAAFRQRVIVGYDPVQRDADGNIMFKRDTDGELVLDSNGNPVPIVNSPGRAGVDRMIVFPGSETKVFDMQESDLTNYVSALDMLVASFASVAQVPPQYLVGDFKNVSGDLMVATEATLRSFVADLQISFTDSWEEVFMLAGTARGAEYDDLATEVIWADAEPKSLTQVASAAAQMVPNGAPMRMFLEMIPGATQDKVNRWMGYGTEALQRALQNDLAAGVGPKPELE